ncbi:AraC family transcriptional regulator [Aestuariicella hydrocarbonica]|uniref:AraC family transcriptional regulator n=2 Tax=Pseudomaricurvus hydrocarbonicus TaxID=1470433 RepID=A0A9E5MJW7_9GAMM|nr:AraC family transcriptional regulator [Aestuariicella hydrocarbonica]
MPAIPSIDSPCIPTSYTRLIASELGLQEKSLGLLLAGTRLEGPDLTSDASLLTTRQQVQILRNSLRLAGDSGFGLRVGNRLTPPTHGALGFLANSSPDLLSAVKAFQDYLPTRMCFIRMDISRSDEWLECHLKVDFEAEVEIYRSLIEAVSLSLLTTIECIIGRPMHDGMLDLRFSAPHYARLYKQYLPCPVRFDRAESCLRIPLQLCYTPNSFADHGNYELALQHCQTLLAQLPAHNHTSRQQVEAYMLTHAPGLCQEENVAEALFITKRTLARRLALEQTSFRALRDELLARLAGSYLRDSRLTVEVVASLLNYHDSANFRRAFKRWYGMTPSEYRRKT